MQKPDLLTSYRIFFALLTFSAVVTEIATLIVRGKFIAFNFFSYFTIESNLFAVFIFILSSLALIRAKRNGFMAMVRGANTLNMILVGIVFTLLLSGIENVEFTAVPWDNIVLHYLMPIVVVLDWFMDIPKLRIRFTHALTWLVFPIMYVLYSLIRGYFVHWYPYPFLNPSQYGYVGVAMASIILIVGATVLVGLLSRSTAILKFGGSNAGKIVLL